MGFTQIQHKETKLTKSTQTGDWLFTEFIVLKHSSFGLFFCRGGDRKGLRTVERHYDEQSQ